ncbi:agamous-like MADS-box protein AGL62 [Cornus florida]|uniref:agamous-like MADS-box protein AGL62 n=1 Tax=Cornus florida TaxID=4283 RepID=UPI00289E44BD|nr:agamous-like MADS-box protein AGL62 [Cornus florida]
MENKAKRQSKGRQIIPMKKIPSKNNLHVTFSKRRKGLMKKAGELSVLCGAEVAVVVVSPAKKIYTFGSPAAEPVIDRFLAQYPNPNPNSSTVSPYDHDDNKLRVQLSKNKYLEALGELEAKTKQGKPSETGYWWEGPIQELGLQDLEHYIASLELLNKNVKTRADQMVNEAASKNNLIMNQAAADQTTMEGSKNNWIMNQGADQMAMEASKNNLIMNQKADQKAMPPSSFLASDQNDQNLPYFPLEGTGFGNDFDYEFGNYDFGNFELDF